MRKFILTLAVLGLVAISAGAKALKVEGVSGADDRKPLFKTDAFWQATGKIQIAGFSKLESCTGVLVAPDLVITAAHCLTDPVKNALVRPSRINFLPGLNKAQSAGHAIGACIRLLGDLIPHQKKHDAKQFVTDAAVIKLAKPLKPAPVALAADTALAAGSLVTHAGYGRDRRFLLSVHSQCKVTGADGDLQLTDCDTTFGQSGGPVLIDDAGTWKLAGIMVGFAEGQGSLVLNVKAWRKLLDEGVCQPE